MPIWGAMALGAFLMIITQTISLESAFNSINWEVIFFLFGMFTIVSGLERSGVLPFIALKMVSKAKTLDSLLLIFIIGMGILSAFLVNDTIALLGIPLVIQISNKLGIESKILLISLAFAISIGSIMTPIGSPQNLLIANQSGLITPFTTFLFYLGIPTIINLFLTFILIRFYFRKDLKQTISSFNSSSYISPVSSSIGFNTIIQDHRLAKICIIILIGTFAGFILSEILHFLKIADIGIGLITLLGGLILYVVSNERKKILQSIDYSILIFFIAMFVVISALWYSGAVSKIMSYFPIPNSKNIVQSNGIISATSISLSQILSNVPFVSLYTHFLVTNDFTSTNVNQWMMLVAASGVAGNLTILGAASNVIIIQTAESRGLKPFTLVEFLKVGSIVTTVNIFVFYVFLSLI
jgi:Na+/H+ antiporter NhaD/arsenite permease-like protein